MSGKRRARGHQEQEIWKWNEDKGGRKGTAEERGARYHD